MNSVLADINNAEILRNLGVVSQKSIKNVLFCTDLFDKPPLWEAPAGVNRGEVYAVEVIHATMGMLSYNIFKSEYDAIDAAAELEENLTTDDVEISIKEIWCKQ